MGVSGHIIGHTTSDPTTPFFDRTWPVCIRVSLVSILVRIIITTWRYLKRHWRRTFIETNTQTSCHDQLTTKIYKPNAQQRLHKIGRPTKHVLPTSTGLCASRTPKTNCSWMLGIYKENVSYSVYLMNAVPPNQHHVLSKFRPASVMTKICPPGTWTSAVKKPKKSQAQVRCKRSIPKRGF